MKRVVFASWEDVPHLTPAMKEKQLADMDPHMRDVRTKGIPFLGSGAVYPVPIDQIEVKPFHLPDHWGRAYGLDVGWKRTAAIWGALDPESDILYLYDEHYVGEENPSVHANAIMGFGISSTGRAKWIPGVMDPAARGRSVTDGVRLINDYRALGLDVNAAQAKATEAAVHEVWVRLSTGRMKVFSHLQYWFKEYMLYRRDANGKIIESKARPDHLMDATKFLVVSGIDRMTIVPPPTDDDYNYNWRPGQLSNGWMAA